MSAAPKYIPHAVRTAIGRLIKAAMEEANTLWNEEGNKGLATQLHEDRRRVEEWLDKYADSGSTQF